MPAVIQTQDFTMNPNDVRTFQINDWANPAHNVQVFVEWLPSAEPRRFKVPMIYVTEQVIASVSGISTNVERQKLFIVGAGVSFIPFKPSGVIVAAILHCRNNGQTLRPVIRARVINFSI